MKQNLRSAGAALLAIGSRASTQLFVVAVTLVATRYLSPDDFGVFAIATVFITLARTLLYTGPFEYLMKAPDLARTASECLAATVLTAAAASIAVLLLALVLLLGFGSGAIAWLMLVLVPTNLLAAMASWEEALLLRAGRLRAYYVATMLIELSSALVAIWLLVIGWQLGALVAQVYLRMGLAVLGYAALMRLPPLRHPRPGGVRRVLRWSSARYGATFVGFLSNYSGDLILGALLSPAATGVFRASNRVVTAASDMFSQPAALLSRTALSHRFAQGRPADGSWFAMFVAIGFIGWPALLGVALLGDWIAVTALGPAWSSAAGPIAILAVARLWSMLTAVATALLVTYDRQRLVLSSQMLAAVGVALATVALAVWGVTGAALAALGVNMAVSLWLARAALRLGPLPFAEADQLLQAILLPSLCTAVGTIVGRLLAVDHVAVGAGQLVLAIGCGSVGWVVGVVLVRRAALGALLLLTQRS
ncbi:oligosaccharide flippase family protein [Sphingomonas radiodurans]|uniref:oligosaccharide flippase family protein n=1 Tax=Sphingomonas radiodurans TaxID=2890321 RepID=UPI001E3C2D8C|nr:oligosaccharide flippase family protein [Sphingomonas radiodurans]WBH17094.1 oligosaccharide flippase family protein [Sphingomonas radiodurans]